MSNQMNELSSDNKKENDVLEFLNEFIFQDEKKLYGLQNEIKGIEEELSNIDVFLKAKQEETQSSIFFVNKNELSDNQYVQKMKNQYQKDLNDIQLKKEDYVLLEERIKKMKQIAMNLGNHDEVDRNILKIQEMERRRIANDLHDSTVQSLTNMIHRLELCTKFIDIDIIRAKLELIGMTESVKDVIKDMREIISDLRPMLLDDLGLGITIQRIFQKMKEEIRIHTELRMIPEEMKLPDVVKLTIFRVIKEACNNIVKHSDADNVVITINSKDSDIYIEIYDDGAGFSINNKSGLNENGNKLGLSIMKERVKLLSGNFYIETNIGKGTKIMIHIPVLKSKEYE